MPQYEWQGSAPFRDRRNDREVEPGEVVELDEHVADPQPQFVEVSADATDGDSDTSVDEADSDETADDEDSSGSDGADEPPLNPDDFAVPELEDALEDGDYSGEELDAIEAAERADGSPRSTALDAIAAQR